MTVIPYSNGKTVHAHKLVAKTAQDMSRELYASMMSNNIRFAAWKKTCEDFGDGSSLLPTQYEELFVVEMFPNLIEEARATLASLLAQPISEDLKNEIHDALIKDAPFRAGRLKARSQTTAR